MATGAGRLAAWSAALLAAGAPARARSDMASLRQAFADEPPDSLVRRLESAAKPTTRPGGLVIRRRPRWDDALGMLLFDVEVTNTAATAQALRRAALLELTFRGGEGRGRYRRLTYRNDTWYQSTYWTGPDWTRVGRNWHHPGIHTPSVRTFRVPRDGRVTVTGRARKADTNRGGGDGVRLAVRHNDRTVWTAEIDGGDDKGVELRLTLDVRRGDAIRFVVHKRGRIFHDTTWWDPAVTYADGRRHQASAAFSKGKQGRGGWFYEMEAGGPKAESNLPRVYAFGSDLRLRRRAVGVGSPVRLSPPDAVGLMVLADGGDRSGIVLARTGGTPWHVECVRERSGRLRVLALAQPPESTSTLRPGASARLGTVALGAYRGPWTRGMTKLRRLLAAGGCGRGSLRDQVERAFARGTAPLDARLRPQVHAEPHRRPDLDLWAMVQDDWRREDALDDAPASYAAAVRSHLAKAEALLADLRERLPEDVSARHAEQLARLARRARSKGLALGQWRALHLRVRWLKRRLALANPLIDFDRLLFCKRVPTSYSHLVMQYFGWRARPGGGLFALRRPGWSLDARDILDGRLNDGNVLEPRLSYDGRRVVFSFVRCGGEAPRPDQVGNERGERFYHIYEAELDAGALRQLTRGPFDDLMPTYLPDGSIVFCSTRRRGYARCFGAQFSRRWHVYTLHRMDPPGAGRRNIRTLSFHDTNEWFPTVGTDGLVYYSRWDYIDRDAVTHQNLWATRPDGTNPAAVWGNATASPHCTFQIQPIPCTRKFVFTASAHHSIAGGSIAVVDPSRADDGHDALKRITPDVPFPEAEGRSIRRYYAAPWPLADPRTGWGAGKYFLVAYSPQPLVWEPRANDRAALGLYLLDAWGNRELLYRDGEIGSTNPCPLRPRPRPPVVSAAVPPPRPPARGDGPPMGEMVLLDVYDGLGTVQRGHIKALRIVQILPKTTPVANRPPIGLAGEENARAILGTVPVEPDGSARFLVPARRPVLFQALDADGFAYQTMRSVTYVQPGEKLSCAGCHENRLTSPPSRRAAALRRPPSRIDPGALGGRPFSFPCVVQPVLDRHCIRCHGGAKPKGPGEGIDLTATPDKGFSRAYRSLCADRDFWGGRTNPRNAAAALVPRFGARNPIQVTPAGGRYGARGSRLIRMLRRGHNDVKLTADELRRLAAWIDCNAVFYGSYAPHTQAQELRRQPPQMPDVQ